MDKKYDVSVVKVSVTAHDDTSMRAGAFLIRPQACFTMCKSPNFPALQAQVIPPLLCSPDHDRRRDTPELDHIRTRQRRESQGKGVFYYPARLH